MTEHIHSATPNTGIIGQQRWLSPSSYAMSAVSDRAGSGPSSEGQYGRSRDPGKGSGRILFAEDEEIIRTLTVKLLEKAGYEVLVASDGAMAKEIFENVHGDIDLALLDVVMPNADGHDVYDFIKEKAPEIPVLFSTGYGLNSAHTKFIAVEGLDVLRKPYSPGILIQKIQEMLAEKH